MKPLLLCLLILIPIQGIADLKENRVYPRISKANNYIAEGKDKEAISLLKEVLEIDSENQKAVKSLVILCSKKKDYTCVNKYIAQLNSNESANYYRANMWYGQHEYAKALKASSAINMKGSLSNEEFKRLKLIGLKSAIHIQDEAKVKSYLSEMFHTEASKQYRSNFEDIVTLLIEKHFFKIAIEEIDHATENGMTFNDKKLENWSHAYQETKRYPGALHLINLFSDPVKKYQKQIVIYDQMNEAEKAAQSMEKYYALKPTSENRSRLIYLYKKAGMTKETEDLYSVSLQKGCNSDDLRNLLTANESSSKRHDLLKQYAPFECLNDDEKYYLNIELVEYYAKNNEDQKALVIIDTLQQSNNMNEKQTKTLIHWYNKLGSQEKSVEVMQKLYAKNPSPENKKQLMYLYDQAKMSGKSEAMHIQTMRKGCNRESLIYLLSQKNNTEALKKYYPYNCLRQSERFNYTMHLVQYYQNTKQTKKAKTILDTLAQTKALTSDNYLELAMKYKALGMESQAIFYAKKANKSTTAMKQLAYSYEKKNNSVLAIKYYKEALKINPKDTKLYLAIGSQYTKIRQPKNTLHYWDKYRQSHNSKELTLLSAEQAMLIPDIQRAERYMNTLSSPPRNKGHQYYMLKYKIAKENKQIEKERYYYEKALAYNSTTDKAHHYAQLGFMYYEDQNYTQAATAFEQSISFKKKIKYNDALGYTYQKLELNEKAITTFEESIDMINTMEQPDLYHRYQLKREIGHSKSFFGYLAYTTRFDQSNNIFNPVSTAIPQSSYNGFTLVELAYRPEALKNYIYFYVRGLSGVKDQSIALEDETWQPSLGIRYKPFRDQNLTFSVEHMFKGGDRTREDTMVRSSWGFFDDYHFHPIETDYWHKSLFLDAAYYIEDEIYSFYANYEHGYIKKVSDETALMPYVSTSATIHNDNFRNDQVKNFDIGLGVSYFFWLNERPYKPHQFTGRFSIEARQSLYNDNTDDENTIRAKFELMF